MQLSKNLNQSEVACRCGCGFNTIDDDLIILFQQIRNLFGKPINVLSGCRCEKHNSSPEVKGSPTSSHLKGLALDIRPKNNTPYNLLKLAVCVGKCNVWNIGISAKDQFIHICIDKTKDNIIFHY